MKHKMLGTLTWDTDLEWHVSLFGGRIKNAYKNQEEAVKFIEDELIRVMDDYEFEVCYRIENKVMARRSYVLIERDANKKLIHTSLSRYEYAKTHFFFYSKDKRRKIFDYKNPDFNQLTRHCISTRHNIATSFFAAMAITLALLTTLLILFMTVLNNHTLLASESLYPESGTYHTEMMAMLATALGCAIVIFGIYLARYFRYSKLVKSDSVWHESYSNVDWRKYYKFVLITRYFASFFTLVFTATIVTFGILFTKSAMFDSMSLVPQVQAIMIVFVFASLSVAAFAYITTYYIVRFRVSLAHIAPAILTEEGLVTYKSWLKGMDVSKEDEQIAFHPVEEHLLYPNPEIVNENPKFAELTDEQIKQFRKDVKNYHELILIDKFGKHGANKEELAAAKARYQVW